MMTKAPFIALVSTSETYNPATHNRRDLQPIRVEIEHEEHALAITTLTLKNTGAPISGLQDQRVLISTNNQIIVDGVIISVPQRNVGQTFDLQIVSRPTDLSILDDQLEQLKEQTKNRPEFDPLFLARGRENDLSEILAPFPELLSYSRIQGTPTLASILVPDNAISVKPLNNSLTFQRTTGVAKRYGVRLTARWSQLNTQFLNAAPQYITTVTPEDFKREWPALNQTFGDGVFVWSSRCEREPLTFGFSEVGQHTRTQPVDENELDPTWIDAGEQDVKIDIALLRTSLTLRYDYNLRREETCEFTIPVNLQDNVHDRDEEIENIDLRDLTQADTVLPWQPNSFYPESSEVTHNNRVWVARRDHTSANTFSSADWIDAGPTQYLESRRVSSFFNSQRGQQALQHAVGRIKSRAAFAARCVRVSFTAPMPDLATVSDKTFVSIEDSRIPGGFVTGKLAEYRLIWDRGRRTFEGVILCIPGEGGTTNTDEFTVEPQNVQTRLGRVSFNVQNDGTQQLDQFNAGEFVEPTVFEFKFTPAQAADLKHESIVSISGQIEFTKQVQT